MDKLTFCNDYRVPYGRTVRRIGGTILVIEKLCFSYHQYIPMLILHKARFKKKGFSNHLKKSLSISDIIAMFSLTFFWIKAYLKWILFA